MTTPDPTASFVFVTFKVTEDGEVGHPMDHVLTRINVDKDGVPTLEALKTLEYRVIREVQAKVLSRATEDARRG